MNKRHFLTFIAWISVAFVVTVGCGEQATKNAPSKASTAQSQPVEITVSAAASMQDAMKAIKPLYKEQHANTKITYNFGSSGMLQQQIEQGAPVDVFVSAADKQMNALQEKNLLLEGTRKDLLKNQVVLVTPKNAKAANISDFKELTSSKVNRFSIGDPESVPAGQYSKQVLTSLKLYDQLKAKTVFAKDVRQVLSYVETGNVDAGIVYATDAKISDQVKIVATAPEDTHKPIIYPVAVLKSSKNPEIAKDFVQFLSSDKAKAVFEQYGFSMAS
ncbi:MAG: molybdate ABC transporter substrate-binding protein [Cyanobacteriota bacterium]